MFTSTIIDIHSWTWALEVGVAKTTMGCLIAIKLHFCSIKPNEIIMTLAKS